MRYLLICTVVGSLLGAFAPASLALAADAPAKKSKASSEKPTLGAAAAIRASSQAFAAAFNRRDAKAIAAMWTEDGEYVDDAGRKYSGREAIEKGYALFFRQNPKAQIRVLVDSVRVLSDGAAIEDGRATVEPAPAGSPGVSSYTAVHVKVDGKWLMANVRDTWIDTPSAYSKVADLEWLIGAWTAEEHGAKSESVCRWVANKSFVERTYSVTHLGGATTSGVQIIGFNPQAGRVQSWNFSSDGGHALGVWKPHGSGPLCQYR